MSKQLPTPVDFSWSRCSSSQFSSLTWTTATTTSSLRRYPTSSHPSSSHIDVHHIKIIFPHTSVLFDYFRITWMLTEHTDLWPQLASRFKFIKPLRSWCKYTEVLSLTTQKTCRSILHQRAASPAHQSLFYWLDDKAALTPPPPLSSSRFSHGCSDSIECCSTEQKLLLDIFTPWSQGFIYIVMIPRCQIGNKLF